MTTSVASVCACGAVFSTTAAHVDHWNAVHRPLLRRVLSAEERQAVAEWEDSAVLERQAAEAAFADWLAGV